MTPIAENHFSNCENLDILKKITGMEPLNGREADTVNNPGYGVTHQIVNWEGIVFIEGYWVPLIEYSLFKEVKAQGNQYFSWGYIDGRQHHLGEYATTSGLSSASNFPGYQIWIESYNSIL